MNPLTLLATLQAKQVEISLHGGQLKLDARTGVLTDADIEEIRAHKPALLQLLSTPAPAPEKLQKAAKSRIESVQSEHFPAPATSGNISRSEQPLELDTPTARIFRAGLAYDQHQTDPAPDIEELPPALIESPDLTLTDSGLWVRDGFVVATLATTRKVAAHCKKKQAAKKAAQLEMAA